MPKPLKPIDRKKKMTRVTFTAKTEVLEWGRKKAVGANRSFANWLAWILEEEKRKEEAGSPAIPTSLDNGDDASAVGKRRASGESRGAER
jgi:hypothetical protein